MVDERAESRGTFGFSQAPTEGWRFAIADRLADWFEPRRVWRDSHGSDDGVREGWLTAHRAPLAMTAVWLGGLGIYAAGYAERMGDPGAVGRAFPALDLLFFAFAAIGPVAMLWMVWLLQARAARLTEAVGAQSESALAVAATLANLHDAVESLAENTTARLADASARVERQSGATLARVDRATGELAERLEAAMLETMAKLDEGLRARASRFEKSLDAQRDALARRLDAEADRLARTVEAETHNLASVAETLTDRIAAGFAENGARFDREAAALLGSLRGRLEAVGERAEKALATAAAELAAAQAARHRDLDEGFARRKAALTHTLDTAARIVEGEIVPLITGLRDALAETRDAVAVHPPASAAELAGLLGDAAEERIRPERVALEDAVGRITALEDLARKMLADIDRTSRLNPLMEPAGLAPAVGPAGSPPASAELPFPALPCCESRTALDWTAAIHALSGESPGEVRRHAVERAAADPDVAALIALARGVADALAEDGLYLSDMAPVHSPAALWARFAEGERGGEIAALAGIEDDVALAIARSRLRDDEGFRRLAIRLVAAYARLVERAAAEIGPDPRLVELAETRPGRAFQLLAGLLHAFRPVPGVTES